MKRHLLQTSFAMCAVRAVLRPSAGTSCVISRINARYMEGGLATESKITLLIGRQPDGSAAPGLWYGARHEPNGGTFPFLLRVPEDDTQDWEYRYAGDEAPSVGLRLLELTEPGALFRLHDDWFYRIEHRADLTGAARDVRFAVRAPRVVRLHALARMPLQFDWGNRFPADIAGLTLLAGLTDDGELAEGCWFGHLDLSEGPAPFLMDLQRRLIVPDQHLRLLEVDPELRGKWRLATSLDERSVRTLDTLRVEVL